MTVQDSTSGDEAATRPRSHTVQHTIDVDADTDAVYDLVADVERWPVVLGPTVHTVRLSGDDTEERLALWATANGEVRSWTSHRRLDRAARRIEFRQERPAEPLAGMGGTWTIEAVGPGRTRIVLDHDFAVVDDDPHAVEWVTFATDRNSTAELAAIKDIAEHHAELEEATRTFTDEVAIRGPASAVYDFLRDAARWPVRLPHVSRLDLTEGPDGVQLMDMETKTPDGDAHTTRSVRVCVDEDHSIVYKQIGLPALLAVHIGVWRIKPSGDEVVASSTHTVRIERTAIRPVLGEAATVHDALAFVRKALGTNSLATLQHARVFAESSAGE